MPSDVKLWYGTSIFSLPWQMVILCKFRSASNFSSFELSWSISESFFNRKFFAYVTSCGPSSLFIRTTALLCVNKLAFTKSLCLLNGSRIPVPTVSCLFYNINVYIQFEFYFQYYYFLFLYCILILANFFFQLSIFITYLTGLSLGEKEITQLHALLSELHNTWWDGL